ncbi:MAG: hypothetical protein OXU53_08940 [Deltaproteobacteria bacterium]|nr:hypothetical protein [Deltaproteobacteria bacterium]
MEFAAEEEEKDYYLGLCIKFWTSRNLFAAAEAELRAPAGLRGDFLALLLMMANRELGHLREGFRSLSARGLSRWWASSFWESLFLENLEELKGRVEGSAFDSGALDEGAIERMERRALRVVLPLGSGS